MVANSDFTDYIVAMLRAQAANGCVDAQVIFESAARVFCPPRQEPPAPSPSVRLEDGLYWLYSDGRRLRLAEPREVAALF